MSLDGFIATKDDDLTFLSMVEQEGEDYGYSKFMPTVDTIILGRRTYDKVCEMGHQYPSHLTIYVVTHTPRPTQDNVQFYTGAVKELVENLKAKPGKHIYCDGGAQIIQILMKEDLVDQYIISIIPTFLGDGIRLFQDGRPPQALELVKASAFEKGLVQMHYKRKR